MSGLQKEFFINKKVHINTIRILIPNRKQSINIKKQVVHISNKIYNTNHNKQSRIIYDLLTLHYMDGLNQSDIRHCTSGTYCSYEEIHLILIFNII